MWVRIGELLWREEAEPTVSEKFYGVVVQVVLFLEQRYGFGEAKGNSGGVGGHPAYF